MNKQGRKNEENSLNPPFRGWENREKEKKRKEQKRKSQSNFGTNSSILVRFQGTKINPTRPSGCYTQYSGSFSYLGSQTLKRIHDLPLYLISFSLSTFSQQPNRATRRTRSVRDQYLCQWERRSQFSQCNTTCNTPYIYMTKKSLKDKTSDHAYTMPIITYRKKETKRSGL